MASAVRRKPDEAGSLSEDLRRLQAEILTGLDSDEEETSGVEPSTHRAIRQVSSQDAKNLVDLTEAVILQATGEESLDDVTQLVLREKSLSTLSTPRSIDLERLVNLEVLSLSHNMLEDIEPLGLLFSLIEVNLNFNRITDLSPLYDCELLEKLFASHNLVESVEGLDIGCPKLRELALFANSLDDYSELVQTLCGLPDLIELHIGENRCCSAPSQRYGLFRDLPSLEVLDGQKVTASDRKFAAAFLEAQGRGDDMPDRAETPGSETSASSSVARPTTAPSVCARPRPPLPPSHTSAAGPVALAPLPPLPGMKLRSSRSNKMDELLTQSREASPEIIESRIPTLDLQSVDLSEPNSALALLTAHHSTLQQWLDTMKIDRENLRFQVRLLQQDDLAQQADQLRADVERLEVENRSSRAVKSEHDQLLARLAEVDKKLRSTSQKSGSSHAVSAGKEDAAEDDDAISSLRWENQLLEKRLERMKKYSEKSRHNFLSAQVNTRHQSSSHGACAVKDEEKVKLGDDTLDAELSTIVADNEAMLRRLDRDVSHTSAGRTSHSSVHAGLHHVRATSKDAQVDVLTLGGEGAEDVEYHG